MFGSHIFGKDKVLDLEIQIHNLNQVCVVDLQLQQFEQDNVELVPDKMVLLTDTELTQYFIQTWNLDYNDPGKMNV